MFKQNTCAPVVNKACFMYRLVAKRGDYSQRITDP